MEFRWVVFITLWTIFGGPIFHSPDTHYEAPTAQEAPVENASPASDGEE